MAEETRTIRIVVDSSKAVDGSAAATRALERMEKAQGSVASSLDRMEQGLSRVAGFLAGALGARSILAAADAFTRFENALRTAGVSASNMAEISTRLFGAANRNGVEIGALSQLYSRASMAAGELGASQDRLLKFVDGVTAGLRLQGGSTESASGALLQLSQALGSGIVRAEEFNSILEGAFPIAQAAARGIDGMGGSVAKLRAAVADGKVTSAVFFDGLLKGFTETERLAAGMSLTVSQGLTVLNNGFVRFVGEVDKSTGFTADLGKALARTGAYMDDLARKQEMLSGKSPTTWINDTIDALDRLDAWLQRGANSINTWLVGALDGLAVAGARGSAMFLESFRLLPDQLGKLFTDAMNSAIEAVERGINSLTAGIADKAPWLGVKGGGVSLGRLSGGGASIGDYSGGILAAGDAAAKRMLQLQEEGRANRAADAASIFYGGEAGRPTANAPTRPSLTTPGKDSQAAADRMSKALGDSSRELDQARAFAEAANQGADAVARLEIHFKALKTAQDVFGKAANDNTKGVAELTAKLEGQALATLKLKNLGDFRADTATLREQNEILEAEVRLAGELPDIRARELATIKVMQEVRAKGLEDNKQDIADRLAVMEANERLKAQGEEIRRSTELWTAPLKRALESIQTTAADAFEGMLNSGKFNFEELGQVFKKMVIRMAAEFMALATVRPVMSVILNAVSPGMASTMGVGGSSGGGGLFGGSGMSMPSFGGTGGGGMFGGVGDFLQQPLASLFSSGAPAGGYADVGALLASGSTGASAAQSGISGIGGASIGSALGAGLGIGMGAYQAITSKSLGGTLGGIGSMIGSGMMLIPGMQTPGMIVTALSAILPSIIGEPDTRTHSSTNASLRYGGGSWYTRGGAYGSGANSSQSESQLRGLTGGIDSVFGLLGGVKDAGKVWGLDASSWTAQGKDWSYTSRATHLVDPNGNREAWRMNMDDMMDTGAAQVAIRSILGGAVGEITATMDTALRAMSAASMGIQETAESITFVDEVYERLGKGALTVRTQFRDLESQFSEMTATTKKLGLSLEPVIAEQKKQTERLGQDYIDALIDPVAQQLRAFADEKASILANVDYIARHTDVIVDMARINEALLRKEADLKEQLYGGAISQLEDAIKRLTYGDLANITGAGTLSGMRASFNATVAQARSGDQSAYQRVASEGLALTDASRGYYASSPEYEAIRREILAIFSELQVQIAGGAAASPSQGSAASAAQAANLNNTQQLQAMVRDLAEQLAESKRDQAETNDLIRRLLSRDAA